ncbi:MAG: hypothetical protein R3C19_07565 [Planctomycetaceae bacterium]
MLRSPVRHLPSLLLAVCVGATLTVPARGQSPEGLPLIPQEFAIQEPMPVSEPVPLSDEATDFIRGLILLIAPRQFEDDDDWGRQKRVQSGLNVGLDGFRLDTSRRWKNVNHGTWQRAVVSLVDPEQNLKLQVVVLPPDDDGVRSFRVTASTRVQVAGRRQEWNRGVRLYSISGRALADLSIDAVFDVTNEVVTRDSGIALSFVPQVRSASLRLDGFRLQSVSHLKGPAIREFGRAIESLLDRRIQKEGPKLASRINAKVQKKPERFEIPIGQLSIFGSETAKPDETPEGPPEDTPVSNSPVNPEVLIIPPAE